MNRRVHVTLELAPPFKDDRPDLNLRISRITSTKMLVDTVVKQSKMPRQENKVIIERMVGVRTNMQGQAL